MAKKLIKVMDTSFRDGFQSIYGAKVLVDDFIPALQAAVDAGIKHFETAGGARFQAPIFFCNENAFDTMDKIRAAVGPDVKLQSLSRGVNVVGLNSQPRDVIDLHAKMFAKHGVNVIRNFDALNDVDNLIDSANSIKKHGLLHEVTITMMELPFGCEGAHDVAFYEKVLRNILDSGLPFDSLAFKDASGTSNPRKVYETIKMAREILGADAHIRFHSHETAGTGLAAYMAALEGGADGIDLAMKPVSGGTGQPDIISMWHALKGTDYDLGLDIKKVMETEEIFKDCMKDYPISPISLAVNPMLIQAPLPGGATATTVNQLKEFNMLHKFPELVANIRECVERGGFGTSVTPVSQFYAQQSLNNTIHGPWQVPAPGYAKMLLGYFGKTPCAPDPELVKWAEEKLTADLRNSKRKAVTDEIKAKNPNLTDEELVVEVEKELEQYKVLKTTEKVVDLNDKDPEKGIKAAEERLIAAGLPVTDENLFIAAACKDGSVDKGIDFLLGKGVVSVDKSANDKKETATCSSDACTVTVNGKKYGVKFVNGKAIVNGKEYDVDVTDGIEETTSATPAGEGTEVKAPMPGAVLRVLKSVGDSVEENEEILVIEAMKMETPIKSPVAGTITSLTVAQGDKISSGQTMATVG